MGRVSRNKVGVPGRFSDRVAPRMGRVSRNASETPPSLG